MVYKSMADKYRELMDRPIVKVKRNRTISVVVEKRQQLERFVSNQDGRCAICFNILRSRRQIHLDHCHETGKWRGALCVQCNTGLGQFGDKIENLERAIKYLIKHGKERTEIPDYNPIRSVTELIEDSKEMKIEKEKRGWIIPKILPWWHGLPDVIDLTAFKVSDSM